MSTLVSASESEDEAVDRGRLVRVETEQAGSGRRGLSRSTRVAQRGSEQAHNNSLGSGRRGLSRAARVAQRESEQAGILRERSSTRRNSRALIEPARMAVLRFNRLYGRIRRSSKPPVPVVSTVEPARKYPVTLADERCTICIGIEKGQLVETKCGHLFHQDCIEKIDDGKCPNCRRDLIKG